MPSRMRIGFELTIYNGLLLSYYSGVTLRIRIDKIVVPVELTGERNKPQRVCMRATNGSDWAGF